MIILWRIKDISAANVSLYNRVINMTFAHTQDARINQYRMITKYSYILII